MRVLNNKGNVVEVSEQNGGITYFSYLKKNRLYYYQIRETQTSAYPWEEDFTGEWTKKVPFVLDLGNDLNILAAFFRKDFADFHNILCGTDKGSFDKIVITELRC